MQRMIPVDKLARPDNHIMAPMDRILQARVDQGLSPTNVTPPTGFPPGPPAWNRRRRTDRRWRRPAVPCSISPSPLGISARHGAASMGRIPPR